MSKTGLVFAAIFSDEGLAHCAHVGDGGEQRHREKQVDAGAEVDVVEGDGVRQDVRIDVDGAGVAGIAITSLPVAVSLSPRRTCTHAHAVFRFGLS